jgi:hypothetical protein
VRMKNRTIVVVLGAIALVLAGAVALRSQGKRILVHFGPAIHGHR